MLPHIPAFQPEKDVQMRTAARVHSIAAVLCSRSASYGDSLRLLAFAEQPGRGGEAAGVGGAAAAPCRKNKKRGRARGLLRPDYETFKIPGD